MLTKTSQGATTKTTETTKGEWRVMPARQNQAAGFLRLPSLDQVSLDGRQSREAISHTVVREAHHA